MKVTTEIKQLTSLSEVLSAKLKSAETHLNACSSSASSDEILAERESLWESRIETIENAIENLGSAIESLEDFE